MTAYYADSNGDYQQLGLYTDTESRYSNHPIIGFPKGTVGFGCSYNKALFDDLKVEISNVIGDVFG
jgi:hypothetical protein